MPFSVKLGDKSYEVPSLTLKQVREFRLDGTLDKLPMNGPSVLAAPETIDALVTVLLAALKRKDATITREAIEENLDLESIHPVVAAVCGASGLVRRNAAGEAEGSQ